MITQLLGEAGITEFSNSSFNYQLEITVHELAHIIGEVSFTASGKSMYLEFPNDPSHWFTSYGKANNYPGNGEYFSEGVMRWVYPGWATNSAELLSVDQANWLNFYLRGSGDLSIKLNGYAGVR